MDEADAVALGTRSSPPGTGSPRPGPHQQRQQVIQIISAAEARGQQRLAEMNRQVPGSLEQIIAALETQADTRGTGAADAR